MGYIDSDAHIVECDHTWDFCDPVERDLMPARIGDCWEIQDFVAEWPRKAVKHWVDNVFPSGSVDLTNPGARVNYMDRLGVDVQVLYPTFWTIAEITSATCEAALKRSYNRWVADATSDSCGRLAWAVLAPVRTMDRALEELEFGKEHGAVSVYLNGQNNGLSIDDPFLHPLFERAQDLDLAIGIHIGGDVRLMKRGIGASLLTSVMPVPSALYAILSAGLSIRFPRLRWAFLEAGASWVPFVLQETYRGDSVALIRGFRNWRSEAADALRDNNLFVATQMDDDLPYLLQFTGPDHLVHGTDFGHLDVGSDPNGLHVIATRDDVDSETTQKIVDTNGRRLYGIPHDFTPAPPPSTKGMVLAPGTALPN